MSKTNTQTQQFWEEWRRVVEFLLSLGVDLGKIKLVGRECEDDIEKLRS